MSWITETAALYDEIKEKVNDSDEWEPILPLYHSTSNAQIQVTIFSDGTFSHAEVVDADDAKTIIPVTEDSSSRSSGIAPHPLCDKLIYISGDYVTYVAKAKSNADEYFVTYIKALKAWAESEYSDICITAIYDYLSKRMLINDLIGDGILKLKDAVLDEEYKTLCAANTLLRLPDNLNLETVRNVASRYNLGDEFTQRWYAWIFG